MDDALAVLFIFGSFAFIANAIVKAVVRSKEIHRQAEVLSRLADADAAAFIESAAGRGIFERLIDRRTLVLQRVLLSVQSGIVLSIVGIALFAIRTQVADPDGQMGLLVFGTLALALGIAFVMAAGASYALSHRWGMLRESQEDR